MHTEQESRTRPSVDEVTYGTGSPTTRSWGCTVVSIPHIEGISTMLVTLQTIKDGGAVTGFVQEWTHLIREPKVKL
jgi:hypothetical protein